ncbi:MAG: hypothetical protein DMD79_04685 [Candidatus Rokuibacteriota bacterium]|nr:MAG: hypothetical protein DMD79_04685 [Candidatus Rokubacteria bacterium]
MAVLCALPAIPLLGTVAVDADLWGHVRTGQLIWARRAVPVVDPWSYTAPGPWLNHTWLADVVLAAAWEALGNVGLLLVRAVPLLVLTGAFGRAVWHRWPSPLGTVLLVAPTLTVLLQFVNMQPQSWTYALTAVVLLLLDASRQGRIAAAWTLPPLLAVWANLHAGFLIGWGLAGFGLVSLCLGTEAAPPPDAGRRRAFLLAALGVAAAPLVNPHGTRLFTYLAAELSVPHHTVLEWSPPTGIVGAWIVALTVASLAVSVLAGWATRWSTIRLSEVVALVVSAAQARGAIKFLALVMLFAPVVLASGFAALGRRWSTTSGTPARPSALIRLGRRWSAVTAALAPAPAWATGVALLAVGSLLPVELPDLQQYAGQVFVEPGRYPQGAVRFLARHPLQPRLATNLAWGDYVIWHVGDRYRVSMDARNTTVYPPDFTNRYLVAWYRGDLRGVLGEHGADALLVETRGALYEAAARDPAWTLAFESPVGSVFVSAGRWSTPPLALSQEPGPREFPG